MRDPSSFVIAGVLPLLLLFIFGFGVTLDLRRVPVAVVIEWPSPEADSLLASFRNSRYFDVRFARHRRDVEHELVSGRLKGVVVLAADFSDRLGRGETAPIQVLVDGSDPNTAGLVQTYVQGLWSNWLDQEAAARRLAGRPPHGRTAGRAPTAHLVQPRAGQPVRPASRRRGDRSDLDRHAADLARGRARVGARDHGGPAGHADHAR